MVTLHDVDVAIAAAQVPLLSEKKYRSSVAVLKKMTALHERRSNKRAGIPNRSAPGRLRASICYSGRQKKPSASPLFSSAIFVAVAAAVAARIANKKKRTPVHLELPQGSSGSAPESPRSPRDFIFGDFLISHSNDREEETNPSQAEDLMMQDMIADESFTFGDFQLKANKKNYLANRVDVDLDIVDEEPDPRVFAFSDFAVALENEMDEEIQQDFDNKKKPSDDDMFVFGDFSIAMPDAPQKKKDDKQKAPVPPAGPVKKGRGTGALTGTNAKHIDLKSQPARSRRNNKTIWSFHTRDLPARPSRIKCLAITSSEKHYVVSCITSPVIMCYETITGREVQSFVGHCDTVTSATISNDDKFLATTSRDCSLIVWDMATARQLMTYQHPKVVSCATFSRNSQFLVTGCQDWHCRLFTTKSKKMKEPLLTFRDHSSVVTVVNFEPNGENVISGGADTCIKLWSAATGKVKNVFKGHNGTILSASYSPNSSLVLSNDTEEIRLWEVSGGACIWTMKSQGNWNCCTFGPGPLGQMYIVGAQNNHTNATNLHIVGARNNLSILI
ncbi:hypothetical protein DIPPA_65268, partial [Diplonema papillatum]